MKTLLWPKILANEKGGGDVKPPMLSFSAGAPPPPLVRPASDHGATFAATS